VHDIVLRLTRAVSTTHRLRNIDGKCCTSAPQTCNKRMFFGGNKVTD